MTFAELKAKQSLTIVAMESSCDETACAVLKDGRVLSSVISSQIAIHKEKQTLLSAEGMPLGILPKPVYHDNALKLSKGDALLLYSDALTESVTTKGTRLGFPTFKRMAMKRILMADPNEGLNTLLQDFFKLVPPPPPDDVTAVLLRWEK